MKFTLLITLFMIAQNSIASEKLKFIGDQNIPTGEKFKETEIGGLSGIVYDQEKNKLLSISDDRGKVNAPRFYEFDLKLDEKTFKVTPFEVTTLKNKEGKPFKSGTVDFEGIAIYDGNVIASSEGWINKEPPINPDIFVFTRKGDYIRNLEIPEKYIPNKEEKRVGARDNLVFEGLSTSPDGKTLFVGLEDALNQDDRIATPSYASTTRVMLYKDLKPAKEVPYKLEKVPSIKVAGLTVGETGLSDLLAIDETHFYSIERSYMPLAKRNVIRLFKVTITPKTSDISAVNALGIEKKKHSDYTPVEKELIADLDEFKAQMTPNFQSLDNVEGICYGPKLSNGHQTIILVSDNNFSKNQRTQFLAFEILP